MPGCIDFSAFFFSTFAGSDLGAFTFAGRLFRNSPFAEAMNMGRSSGDACVDGGCFRCFWLSTGVQAKTYHKYQD